MEKYTRYIIDIFWGKLQTMRDGKFLFSISGKGASEKRINDDDNGTMYETIYLNDCRMTIDNITLENLKEWHEELGKMIGELEEEQLVEDI